MKLKLWAWREVANGSGRVPGLAGPAAVIPDAVLCSEMGVQFSPCGRFLAACVACQPVRSHNFAVATMHYKFSLHCLPAGVLPVDASSFPQYSAFGHLTALAHLLCCSVLITMGC